MSRTLDPFLTFQNMVTDYKKKRIAFLERDVEQLEEITRNQFTAIEEQKKKIERLEAALAEDTKLFSTLHEIFYENDQRHKKRIKWLEERVEAGDRHQAELELKYHYTKEELKELTEKK